MNCPSCSSPLEPNARFCGVCGYRLQASRPAPSPQPSGPAQPRAASPAVAPPRAQTPAAGNHGVKPQPVPQKPAPQRSRSGIRGPNRDDIYLEAVLNNRFKVESKIGEGGFGAVYRGVQLATGRKVALKLLHPEMTKDENLVARRGEPAWRRRTDQHVEEPQQHLVAARAHLGVADQRAAVLGEREHRLGGQRRW